MRKKKSTGKKSPAAKSKTAVKTKAPAKSKTSAALDHSTEERILQAAQKLFTQKGFAATRTRDIAAEAGINLALLNYYFRSKEKLFDLVMLGNVKQFMMAVAGIMSDDSTSLEKKIEQFAATYIDSLSGNPDIPLFIMNAIQHHPEKLVEQLEMRSRLMQSSFVKQVQEAAKAGRLTVENPAHFIMNMLALVVFPFVANPMLHSVGIVDKNQFAKLMQERKTLIPVWIKKAMFKSR